MDTVAIARGKVVRGLFLGLGLGVTACGALLEGPLGSSPPSEKEAGRTESRINPHDANLLILNNSLSDFSSASIKTLQNPLQLNTHGTGSYQYLVVPVEQEKLSAEMAALAPGGYMTVAVPTARLGLRERSEQPKEAALGLGSLFTRDVAGSFPHYGKTFTQEYKFNVPLGRDLGEVVAPRKLESHLVSDQGIIKEPGTGTIGPYRMGNLDLELDRQLLRDLGRQNFSLDVQGKKLVASTDFAPRTDPGLILERVADEAYRASRLDGVSEAQFKQNLIYGLQTRVQTYDADMGKYLSEGSTPFAFNDSAAGVSKVHKVAVNGEVMTLTSNYTFGLYRLGSKKPSDGLVDIQRQMTVNLRTGEMSPEIIKFSKSVSTWGKRAAIIAGVAGAAVAGGVLAFYFATGFDFKEDDGAAAESGSGDQAGSGGVQADVSLDQETTGLVVSQTPQGPEAKAAVRLPAGTFEATRVAACTAGVCGL